MFYKIKKLKVINANLFSCPYTAGFSLASFKGFVDFLSIKTSELSGEHIVFEKFGIIVISVTNKIKEPILRDTSTGSVFGYNKKEPKIPGSYSLPSLLQQRYFDFEIELILEYNGKLQLDTSQLAKAINLSKIQSGLLVNQIESNDIIPFSTIKDRELTYNTYSLGYFITDAHEEINPNNDIIEQFCEKLSLGNQYRLICNGYKKIMDSNHTREIDLQDNVKSIFVEPNIMLSKSIQIYDYNKNNEILKNFMFSTINKKDYFIVEAN